jgi:hypothetical protein
MAGLGMPVDVEVVDEKLAAGRGEEFSAARVVSVLHLPGARTLLTVLWPDRKSQILIRSARLQRERREQQLFGLDDDFFLPISHRADDALETSGIQIATVDTALSADNKGYQMLQRMGWGGRGLGRNEDGVYVLRFGRLSMQKLLHACPSVSHHH